MKLYPFVYIKDKSMMVVGCFEAVLHYHGYHLERKDIEYLLGVNANGVTLERLINGLDALQVLYEVQYTLSLRQLEGVMIKRKGEMMLCCGHIGQYICLMHPQKGYLWVKFERLITWPIDYAIHIKFLGNFPYPKKDQTQRQRRWARWCLAILLNGLISFLPFSKILLFFPVAFFYLILHHQYLRKQLRRQFGQIDSSFVREEWIITYQSYHYGLIKEAHTRGLQDFIIVYLSCFSLWAKTYFAFMGIVSLGYWILNRYDEKPLRKILYLGSYPLLLCLIFTGLIGLYQAIYQSLSFEFIFDGVIIALYFCLRVKLRSLKEHVHAFDLAVIQKVSSACHYQPQLELEIESIGINDVSFDVSTLIEGDFQDLYDFYQILYSPALKINAQQYCNGLLFEYHSSIHFLEDFLLREKTRTIQELFADQIDLLIDYLNRLNLFEDVLLLSKTINDLSIQKRELFGFLRLLIMESGYCLIKNAFLFQPNVTIVGCLSLLSEKASKIRMILLVSETKGMNKEACCAIIRHEKVGDIYERNRF